jgi:hypothetical protein
VNSRHDQSGGRLIHLDRGKRHDQVLVLGGGFHLAGPAVSELWPSTVAEAEVVQDRLRPLVDLVGPGPVEPGTIAGLDVAYAEDGDRLAAAVTVLDPRTLAVVDAAVTVGRAAFPYVPGLFAFRELPALLDALGQLAAAPDLLVCDEHGLAQPRRFGLACHLGVLTGLPAIGGQDAAGRRVGSARRAPGRLDVAAGRYGDGRPEAGCPLWTCLASRRHPGQRQR